MLFLNFPFIYTQRPGIDAAHWPRTVISAKSGDEVDQPDGHCEVYDAGATSCLIRKTRKDPTGLVGSVWMEQISKVTRLTCCARPLLVVHMADCHFLCVPGSLTQSSTAAAAAVTALRTCQIRLPVLRLLVEIRFTLQCAVPNWKTRYRKTRIRDTLHRPASLFIQ